MIHTYPSLKSHDPSLLQCYCCCLQVDSLEAVAEIEQAEKARAALSERVLQKGLPKG
jgi:hypothetical protein